MGTPKMYKTTDMGTVAFLRYQGYESQECSRDSEGQVYWLFFHSDGLLRVLDTYNSGDSRVEPKSYNAEFASVKRELHRA